MGFFDSIKSTFGAGGPNTRRVTPEEESRLDNGLDEDSAFKPKSSTKEQKKSSVNPDPEDLSKNLRTALTEGFAKHPVIADSDIIPADFYRRGKIRSVDDDEDIPENIRPVDFEVNPRRIDDPEEEEPASIRLLGKKSAKSKSRDVDLVPPYTKFFLESVQESHAERNQIVETFGDFFVFFFGERPPVYTFSGTLVNGKSLNWVEDWRFMYDNFLRGTKAVERNAKVILTYGKTQVEGFILNTSQSKQAISNNSVGVQFQVLVVDRKVQKLSIDFGLIEVDGKFNQDQSFIDLLNADSSKPEVSDAIGDARNVVSGVQPSAVSKVLGSSKLDSIQNEFNLPMSSVGNKLRLA